MINNKRNKYYLKLTAFLLCFFLTFVEEGTILANAGVTIYKTGEPGEETVEIDEASETGSETAEGDEITVTGPGTELCDDADPGSDTDEEDKDVVPILKIAGADGASGEKGGTVSLNASWNGIIDESNNTVKLTEYKGLETEIIIPEDISGNTVISIGDGSNSVFNYPSSVTQVTLSDTVKNLGSSAFKNCKQLTKIDLGKVETIGSYCFDGDILIEEVTLPETLTTVGNSIFRNCSGIRKIILNSSELQDAKEAFSGCSSLEDIEIGESCTMIPSSLYQYTSISSCAIPDNVKKIGSSAFKNCRQLKKIDLGKVETIGSYCFDGDILIEEVTLPETLTAVGDSIFRNCSGIRTIILNSSELQDLKTAFTGCSSLENIEFSESCTMIPAYTFYGSSISSCEIPANIKKIGGCAFKCCRQLESINLGNVETIGNYAFEECNSLRELNLPESLYSVGTDAFYRCNSVQRILYDCKNATFKGNYGTPFQSFNDIREIRFGKSVEVIPNSLLSKSSVVSAYIEADNINLSRKAFDECDRLEEVYFSGRHYNFADDSIFSASPEVTIYAGRRSDALCYALRNKHKFVSYEDDVSDSSLDYTKSDLCVNRYSNISHYLELGIDYSFKYKKANLTNGVLTVFVGEKTALNSDNPVRINGIATEYTINKGLLTVPVTSPESHVDITLSTAGITGSQGMYASISSSDHQNSEVIGTLIIGSEMVTLDTPSKTSLTQIDVKGCAPVNSEVVLLIDDTEIKRVKANKQGFYESSLNLPSPVSGKTYSVKVSVSIDDETYSASRTVEYNEKYIKVTRFDYYYYTHSVIKKKNLLNTPDNTNILLAPRGGNQFCVDVDNRESIDKLYVVSNKNGNMKNVELTWNDTLNCYYSNEFFDKNDHSYVPGEFSLYYTEKNDISKTEIIPATKLDDEVSNKEEEIAKYELPDSLKNATVTIHENTPTRFSSTISNGQGGQCFVNIDKWGAYHSTGSEYISIKKKIEADGIEFSENLLGANYVENETLYTYILDRSNKEITRLAIKDFSNLLGKDLRTAKDVYSLLGQGNAVPLFKNVLKKELGIGGSCVDFTLGFFGITFDELVQLKQIECSNLKPEEKARLREELDKVATKKLAALEMNIISNIMITHGVNTIIAMGFTPFGLALVAVGIIVADYAMWYSQIYKGDGIGLGEYLDFCGKRLRFIIDPSGTVYEGVSSNYLPDVRATIYYQNGSEEVQWDAEEYDQHNPLMTDSEGAYAWDVPEGKWRVKFEKDDYETAYSEWMDVPPEQTDINIWMKSIKAPEISQNRVRSSGIEIDFSQYMDPKSLSAVKIYDQSGNLLDYKLIYDDSGKGERGEVLADKYLFKFTGHNIVEGEVFRVEFGAGITNYCGKHMPPETVSVRAEAIETICVRDNINVALGSTLQVPVKIENYDGNDRILCKEYNDLVISASVSIPDQEGKATLSIRGLMPGQSDLKLGLSDGIDTSTVKFIVGEKSDTRLDPPSVEETDPWRGMSAPDPSGNNPGTKTEGEKNNDGKENKRSIDRIPVIGSNKYASSKDNFAPVADSGRINKLKLDFSNVSKSDVKSTDLKMTVIKGSKFTTEQKLKDGSSATASGGVKVKINKKTLIPTISCKADGSVTLTMEDDVTYTVNFTVQKPKAEKTMRKLSMSSEGSAPVIRSIRELFNTDIDSGELNVTKGRQASVSGNVIVINPTEKDNLKIEYKYINKKYKTSIKIK